MPDTLPALAARAAGLSTDTTRITPRAPLEIQANRLYDAWDGDRHLIIKEYLLPAEQHDAAAREFQALRLLAPLDIAPQPVFYDPALGPVVIYEYMAGHMWDRRPPTATGLAALAQTWLKMNSMPSEHLWLSHGHEQPLDQIVTRFQAHFQAYSNWVEAEYAPGKPAAEMCLALIERRREVLDELAQAQPVLCLCRADPRFANVIQRPDGRIGLIDWEDSGLRDPARDLADILTHPNQEDLVAPDAWQAFLQPYLAERAARDAGLIRRAHLYQALFPIFWLTVIINQGPRLAEAGRWENWMINGLPPNQRLRRYLARALAWPQADFAPELKRLEETHFFPSS